MLKILANTVNRCFKSKITIFQAMNKKGVTIMTLIGLTFSAAAGICFIGGIAVLFGGKER